MAHYSRLHTVVVDVPEESHQREMAFWEGATGQALKQNDRYPEYSGALMPGDGFVLLVQRIDSGTSRVHLDIHTDDVDAEVARLERLGARRERYVNGWWIMRDPADLLFCVIPEQPGRLDDDNAHRWD